MTVMSEEDYLAHFGILRKSGRYPWGSGKTQNQRNKMFLDTVKDLRKQGIPDKDIAKGFDMTLNDLRQLQSIAKNEQKQSQINMALRLQDKGMSNVKIGERMGLNESTVRSLTTQGRKDKEDQLQSIADMLKRQVEEKGYLDVGLHVERALPLGENVEATIGVSKEKFQTAVRMLREEGYEVHPLKLPQLGTKDMTRYKILVKPGVSQREVWENRGKIRSIHETEHSQDNGRSWTGIKPPESISSKRVGIRWAEDGGADSDGVIHIRPGAKGLDMGGAQYAQVRIAVDNTHYLKGMAVYKDGLPHGVDLVFNTNKDRSGSKLDAMKPLNKTKEGNVDWENPFGAVPKPGGQRGHLNILREEGDWETWSRELPSQMLSKQSPTLAKQQLDMLYERRRREFDEINALTNPTVKRKLLESFSDGVDVSSVHLEAANMPHQANKVLMPVPSLKPHEVYAPSFDNGTRLSLVRFPHGGTFEIPEVTVNNRHRESIKLLGPQAKDAIGIHPKVAERLSGADFDGDYVVAIPNARGQVKSKPALDGLKGFDPRRSYPAYDGMKTVNGGVWNAKKQEIEFPIDPRTGKQKSPNNRMQHQMGDISNLITDMTIKGANTQELAQAVRHSMVVIDSEKHVLDYKSSARDNGIHALKLKYQPVERRGKIVGGGASTIISRARSETTIPEIRKRRASEGGFVDPKTGKKVFVRTDATYTDAQGKVHQKVTRIEKLAIEDDAHVLVSDRRTPTEVVYADHSNRLKALSNEARKTMISIKPIRMMESSKKVYSKQVESLDAKLDIALRNAPRERQAQALGNAVVRDKKRANPGMSDEDERKIRRQALAEMRVRTGAKKDIIKITPDEWEAIQAGAVSNDKLKKILQNGDIEEIKKLAMPRVEKLMTSTATARAKAMKAQGFTQAEIAEQLGVSLTTLKTGLE